METEEYINSGILELYIFGLLTETQNIEVNDMAKKHQEIDNEIINIEKSVLNLSMGFAPLLSVENFEKIKSKLELKQVEVIQLQPKPKRYNYIGWVAAAVFLLGMGFLYNQQIFIKNKIVTLENEKSTLNGVVETIEKKNEQNKKVLDVIRNSNNTVVNLKGQTISPTSFAKVYWNKNTQTVYIDGKGLPEPSKGMAYQVWSLKLKPSLTPTSIGLMDDFSNESERFFEFSVTNDFEGFGITLEPASGSKVPTMSRLYTLGII